MHSEQNQGENMAATTAISDLMLLDSMDAWLFSDLMLWDSMYAWRKCTPDASLHLVTFFAASAW